MRNSTLLTAMIVDDEDSGRAILTELLNQHFPDIDIIGETANPFEVESMLKNLKPDILLLDIQMPGIDGFNLLDNLRELESQVIFITAFREFAARAFRYNAVDFLVKPIDIEHLKEAIYKAVQNKTYRLLQHLKDSNINAPKRNVTRIAIKVHDKIVMINEEDILYLHAQGNYTRFICRNDLIYMASKNLKSFEKILNHDNFLRIHHSYLLNTEQEYVFDGLKNQVFTENGETLPVSIRKKKDVMNMYLFGSKNNF